MIFSSQTENHIQWQMYKTTQLFQIHRPLWFRCVNA